MKRGAPLRFGATALPSRFGFGPHATNLGEDRALSAGHVAYYHRRAQGGAGWVVVETASVHSSDHPYELAPLAARCGEGWAAIARACQAEGTAVLAGLGHAGHQGSSAHHRRALWAPSPIADPAVGEVPLAMGEEEIAELIDGFAVAARDAVDAGCDGVAIDAGAWSLLRQFWSPLTNQRDDRWGHDRAALAVAVVHAVRQAVGPRAVVAIRLCVDEGVPWGGLVPADAVALASRVAHLADVVVATRGSGHAPWLAHPDHHHDTSGWLEAARQLRHALPSAVAVVAQGWSDDVDALDRHARRADHGTEPVEGLEITRALLADPDLPRLLAAGNPRRVRPCVRCNQGCQVRDLDAVPVRCAVAPLPEAPEAGPPVPSALSSGAPSGSPAASPADPPVLVVGAGPAGLEAARTLAAAGRQVEVVDAGPAAGGALLEAGGTPAAVQARAPWGPLVRWYDEELARLGVPVTGGTVVDAEAVAARWATHQLVVATGSRPSVPDHPVDPDAMVVDVATVVAPMATTPLDPPSGLSGAGHPAVVWDPTGGPAGIAAALRLAAAGDPVTLVVPDAVAGRRLAPTGDPVPAARRLATAGVAVLADHRLVQVARDHVEVEHRSTGERRSLPAAVVVDAGPRTAHDALARAVGARRWDAGLRAAPTGGRSFPAEAVETVETMETAGMVGAGSSSAEPGSNRSSDGRPTGGEPPPVGPSGIGVATMASGGFARRVVVGDAVAPRDVSSAIAEGRFAALQLLADAEAAGPANAAGSGLPGTEPRPAAAPTQPMVPELESEPAPAGSARAGVHDGVGATGALDAARPGPAMLFEPFSLGRLRLRNRVVFPAHLTDLSSPNGLVTEALIAYYEARAAGGVGLIVTEEHTVAPGDRPYRRLLRGWDPQVAEGDRRVTTAVHAHGAAVVAQLNHNGPQADGTWTRRPVWGPSAVPDPHFGEVPVAIGPEELAELVAGYVAVARRCVEAGFDGVEIQASQSSILRAFLSPATNRRTDRYGGSLQGRARLLVEVVDAVRRALGPDLVIGVRLAGHEHVPGGTTPDDGVAVGRLLADRCGVDYLSTTMGVATASLWATIPAAPTSAGAAAPFATALRAETGLPVIGVGRYIRPQEAERALQAGHADLVGAVRAQIADPAWTAKARAGAERAIQPCLGCNQGCVARVALGRSIGCVVNPTAGREDTVPAPVGPPDPGDPTGDRTGGRGSTPAVRGLALDTGARGRPRRNVVVVGAGPAGLAAAATAAAGGARVVVLERAATAGGQLALAATAPGRRELGRLVAAQLHRIEAGDVPLDGQPGEPRREQRRDHAAGPAGDQADDPRGEPAAGTVEVRYGVEATTAIVAGLDPQLVVVATGARHEAPRWASPGDGSVWTAAAVLEAHRAGTLPSWRRVVLVDHRGGGAAPSVAQLLADRALAVTLITDAMVEGRGLDLTLERERWQRSATAAGIEQHTALVPERWTPPDADGSPGELLVRCHLRGAARRFTADAVVVCAPPVADDALYQALRRTLVPGGVVVRRAGDCVAPRTAQEAVFEGTEAGALP